MRRVMLTFALMLWASQVNASVLFAPDSFTLNVRAVFNDTNTDTFCWQCGDSNPLNDFRAVLENFPDLSESWTDFQTYAGLLQLQSTATSYLGLDANFSLHVKLTASGASLPESLVSPSVSYWDHTGKAPWGGRRKRYPYSSVAMETLEASSFDKRSSLQSHSSCLPRDFSGSPPWS